MHVVVQGSEIFNKLVEFQVRTKIAQTVKRRWELLEQKRSRVLLEGICKQYWYRRALFCWGLFSFEAFLYFPIKVSGHLMYNFDDTGRYVNH